MIKYDKNDRKKLLRISMHKSYLRRTDYIVIKIAEASTAEAQAALRQEYADIITERSRVRALINQLEAELNAESE